jgi:hypothetical protein
MTNVGVNDQLWVCPIVRDSTKSSLLSAHIVVTQDVGDKGCTLFSRTSTAVLVGSRSPAEIDPDAEGFKILKYSGIASAEQGFYTFVCVIPPGGQVISYFIVEES